MTKYVISIVVDVDDSYWSEQNDRDLSCMHAVLDLLENSTGGADEVPYLSIRPAKEDEKNNG